MGDFYYLCIMERTDYYVYIQLRLSNGEPFNVGEGTGRRCLAKTHRSKRWNEVVKEEGGFDVIILEKNLKKEEAYEKETYWIQRLSTLYDIVNVKKLTVIENKLTRLEKCLLAKEKGYTYNPITGHVIGLKNNVLNSYDEDGYLIFIVCHNGNKYHIKQHHFAWFMTYGDNMDFILINHKNENRGDNRITNLEVSNFSHNQHHRHSVTIAYDKKYKKFRSRITVNGKCYHLGSFETSEEAQKAYNDAKLKWHNSNPIELPNTERKGYFLRTSTQKYNCKVTINKKTYYKVVDTEEEAKNFVKDIRNKYQVKKVYD